MVKNVFRLFKPNITKTKVKSKRKIVVDEGTSITNNPVGLLASRYEFFLPKFSDKSISYYVNYIILWVTFSHILFISHKTSLELFFFEIVRDFLFLVITSFPAFVILDSYRDYLRDLSIGQVCSRVVLLFAITSIVAMVVVSILPMLYFGAIDIRGMAMDMLINAIGISIVVLFVLLYYLHRHKEFLDFEKLYQLKLASQNELFNARMSPHFFFNTINGLTSLVESDPNKAVTMLGNISTLFRASFDDAKEISMEEEIELCQVFLQIDEMRFHSKLDITWNLPDEDLMYDMVITGLTLQRVLEKILHHVVELTTENIKLVITITWKYHQVVVIIDVELPIKTLLIRHDLVEQMNFEIQEQRLKQYFGEESRIDGVVNRNKIKVGLNYPLHDPCVTAISYDEDIKEENVFINN
ncbi:MAG: histidine kinase [Moraxellaceae bacterium]|nr:histidine kinase [Moraxellaceae bacterium]